MTDTVLHQADLALGANLGDRADTLQTVIARLKADDRLEVVGVSRLYTTSPVDSSGPDYINGVVRVRTALSPMALLALCQALEQDFGRVRPVGVHNAPRTLDVDVLTYDALKSDDPRLVLPHPRMMDRLFVLVPLRDIDPTWTSPSGEGIEVAIARVHAADPSQKIRVYEES